MTTVAAPARAGMGDLDVRPGDLVRAGLIAGAVLLLVIGVGMFEVFNGRKMIDPFLSAGYAAIVWIPIVFGYRVSVRPVLEGIETTPPGPHNIIAGLITGAIAGAMLGLLLIFASVVDIRSIFINISPSLIDLLSYGGSVVSGAAVIVVGSALLGAAGGAFHLMSERAKMVLLTIAATVIGLNFLELVIGDILRAAGLRQVDRWIYAPSRGVTPLAAVLICAAVIGLRFALKGRVKVVGARYEALPEVRRRRWMLITGLVAIGLGTFLPTIFGLFLNEVLSNVGLFILLGLGLNIVVGYAGLLDLGYVAFFAVGAYTTAVTTSSPLSCDHTRMAFFQALPWVLWSWPLIAGLVIGTPVIRMRGDYLAIVTLGFGEIIRIAFQLRLAGPSIRWSAGNPPDRASRRRGSHQRDQGRLSGMWRPRPDWSPSSSAISAARPPAIERGEVGPLPNGHHNPRPTGLLMGLGSLAAGSGSDLPDVLDVDCGRYQPTRHVPDHPRLRRHCGVCLVASP
jgi:branched-chain amino acid transport system permease protein